MWTFTGWPRLPGTGRHSLVGRRRGKRCHITPCYSVPWGPWRRLRPLLPSWESPWLPRSHPWPSPTSRAKPNSSGWRASIASASASPYLLGDRRRPLFSKAGRAGLRVAVASAHPRRGRATSLAPTTGKRSLRSSVAAGCCTLVAAGGRSLRHDAAGRDASSSPLGRSAAGADDAVDVHPRPRVGERVGSDHLLSGQPQHPGAGHSAARGPRHRGGEQLSGLPCRARPDCGRHRVPTGGFARAIFSVIWRVWPTPDRSTAAASASSSDSSGLNSSPSDTLQQQHEPDPSRMRPR
jgi:hypothetical protein